MKINTPAPAIQNAVRENHYPLENIHLDKTGENTGRLMATDGKIAATFPVDLNEADKPGPIPPKAWELFIKSKLGTTEAGDTFMGVPRGLEDDTGSFPVTGMDKIMEERQPDAYEIAVEFGLDVELLARLVKAMGCKGRKTAPVIMRMIVQQDADGDRVVLDAIHVRPNAVSGHTPADMDARGVIMPIRIK